MSGVSISYCQPLSYPPDTYVPSVVGSGFGNAHAAVRGGGCLGFGGLGPCFGVLPRCDGWRRSLGTMAHDVTIQYLINVAFENLTHEFSGCSARRYWWRGLCQRTLWSSPQVWFDSVLGPTLVRLLLILWSGYLAAADTPHSLNLGGKESHRSLRFKYHEKKRKEFWN